MKHWLISVLFLSITAFAQPPLIPDDANIQTITDKISREHVSCESIIEYYLDRIKHYNFTSESKAPLNAFVTLNPNALADAKSRDHDYKISSKLVGPLHCVPVILKDNIDSLDTPSSSGTFALLGSQPQQDAVLVQRLKEAGAIIIGKGGMDELANGANGISSRSGRVGNVYNPNKNPGGSSSGPAVAVAANFAVIGIGTDNSGSVRIPATFNGLFSLRPTMGRINTSGIFPSGSLDGVPGPIAKSTEDLALTFNIMAHDPLKALDTSDIKGKTIAIVTRAGKIPLFDGDNKEINALFDQTISRLKTLGANLVEIELPAFNSDRQFNAAGDVQLIDQYLSKFPSTRKNFLDICESGRTANFNDESDCKKQVKDDFKLDGPEYQHAKEIIRKNKVYIEQVMNKRHIDALLLPISVGESGEYDMMKVKTWNPPVSSNSGLPSVSFIVGYLKHHDVPPIAMEFIGHENSESTLLNFAYAYEQAYFKRLSPKLSRTSNKKIASLSIPELNNMITTVGAKSYSLILKNGKPLDLKPEVFRQIFNEAIPSSLYEEIQGRCGRGWNSYTLR